MYHPLPQDNSQEQQPQPPQPSQQLPHNQSPMSQAQLPQPQPQSLPQPQFYPPQYYPQQFFVLPQYYPQPQQPQQPQQPYAHQFTQQPVIDTNDDGSLGVEMQTYPGSMRVPVQQLPMTPIALPPHAVVAASRRYRRYRIFGILLTLICMLILFLLVKSNQHDRSSQPVYPTPTPYPYSTPYPTPYPTARPNPNNTRPDPPTGLYAGYMTYGSQCNVALTWTPPPSPNNVRNYVMYDGNQTRTNVYPSYTTPYAYAYVFWGWRPTSPVTFTLAASNAAGLTSEPSSYYFDPSENVGSGCTPN